MECIERSSFYTVMSHYGKNKKRYVLMNRFVFLFIPSMLNRLIEPHIAEKRVDEFSFFCWAETPWLYIYYGWWNKVTHRSTDWSAGHIYVFVGNKVSSYGARTSDIQECTCVIWTFTDQITESTARLCGPLYASFFPQLHTLRGPQNGYKCKCNIKWQCV